MLGNPYHYRDPRTEAAVKAAHRIQTFDQLYEINGLQFLPFNTVYQLVAEESNRWLEHADSLLLVPDLFNFWLTGQKAAERTNASTTGLLNVHTRDWDSQLLDHFNIPRRLLPPLIDPGSAVGTLRSDTFNALGFRSMPAVTAVGSHDTASAVVAVPAVSDNFAYISSGTWSLVGVELDHPVVTEESRAANFTNEGGVDNRIRFLKNVSGLWLLSESIRTWENEDSARLEIDVLLGQAALVPNPVLTFDANDAQFIPPGDMPRRIAEWYTHRGLRPPHSRAEFVRSILESLALAYADAVEQASKLSGRRIDIVHIVGGGSQNDLLCQLTADRTGRPVIAGPVEATAIGNVLIQARSQGMVHGTLESLRRRVAVATSLRPFQPSTAGV